MPFVRAYPRETQEMMFDAHDKAFAFYGGVCRRGIYDNMKTAVDAVFVGRARTYNRRFLQMCSHHLVEPTACTPASGWEKGQVENQVGTMRDVLFRPRPRVKTLASSTPGSMTSAAPTPSERGIRPRYAAGRLQTPASGGPTFKAKRGTTLGAN
jgi:transposase